MSWNTYVSSGLVEIASLERSMYVLYGRFNAKCELKYREKTTTPDTNPLNLIRPRRCIVKA